MNIEFLREKTEGAYALICDTVKELPITVSYRVYFENARHEECELSDKGVKYVNSEIIFLPNGASESDGYLFGLCLLVSADGKISYPSSKKNKPDAEAEFLEMLDNATEYATKLAESDEPLVDMAYDLQRAKGELRAYEERIEKMKRGSIVLLGVVAFIIACVAVVAIIL